MKKQAAIQPIDEKSIVNISTLVPPRAYDSESAIIGLLMEEPDKVREFTKLSSDMFTDPDCRTIFEAAVEVGFDGSNEPVTLTRIRTQLAKSNYELTIQAQVKYSHSCGDIIEWKAYETAIADAYNMRRIYEGALRVADFVSRNQRLPYEKLISVAEEHFYGSITKKYGTNERNVVQLIDEWIDKPAKTRGYTSGISVLDEITAGFGRSGFVVLLGYPGAGKTTFCAQVALHLARQSRDDKTKQTKPVLVVATEMSSGLWQARLVAQLCGADFKALVQGTWLNREEVKKGNILHKQRLQRLQEVLAELKDLIDNKYLNFLEDPSPSVQRVESEVKMLNPGVVFIDTINNLNMGSGMEEFRRLEQNANSLQMLFKSREILIIVVAQMSQSANQRGNKMKVLSTSDARQVGVLLDMHATLVLSLIRYDVLVKRHIISEDDIPADIKRDKTYGYVMKDRMFGQDGARWCMGFNAAKHGYYGIEDGVHSDSVGDEMVSSLNRVLDKGEADEVGMDDLIKYADAKKETANINRPRIIERPPINLPPDDYDPDQDP